MKVSAVTRWRIPRTTLFPIVLLISIALGAAQATLGADDGFDDSKYDRLDGHGASGKKVDVIEWEGNLQIHVYPGGSLLGLGLKLDKRNKNKPVMVISYRFDNGQRLIRRAILGIPMNENFKVYKDPTANGYDKIIITSNQLSGQVMAYKLDATPTQLYPDEHPLSKAAQRGIAQDPAKESTGESEKSKQKATKKKVSDEELLDSGSIRHFDF